MKDFSRSLAKKEDFIYIVKYLKEVDSTNTYLKNHPEYWNENFNTIYTYNQKKGRGQHNRNWSCIKEKDLAFSLVFIPEKNFFNNSVVTFYTGIAVFKALVNYLDNNLNLKWPNDLYHDEKKLAGILCEKVIANNSEIIIIGIGLNINSNYKEIQSDLNAVSMQDITGISYNLELVLNDLLKEIRITLNKIIFPVEEEILSFWRAKSTSIGKEILFEKDQQKKRGIFKGINKDLSVMVLNLEDQEIINYNNQIVFIN